MQQRGLAERAEFGDESALSFHTSGFMVQVDGTWTEASLARFGHFLQLRGLAPSRQELTHALQRARREYLEGDHTLYICGERPCRRRGSALPSERALSGLSAQTGLQCRITGCHALCKQAPVAALRVNQRSQRFAQVSTEAEWSAVLAFSDAAARADTLLVSAGPAQHLLHDPVHPPERAGARRHALDFLIGRFRGEGTYSAGTYSFRKELVGTNEAGGRFIALRMEATYPMADGSSDVHRALVIVGARAGARTFRGCAYTDGGITHEYVVQPTEQGFEFADAAPDHSEVWKRVRKVLQPTPGGFQERLDVDAGDGYRNYYSIDMRRVDACPKDEVTNANR